MNTNCCQFRPVLWLYSITLSHFWLAHWKTEMCCNCSKSNYKTCKKECVQSIIGINLIKSLKNIFCATAACTTHWTVSLWLVWTVSSISRSAFSFNNFIGPCLESSPFLFDCDMLRVCLPSSHSSDKSHLFSVSKRSLSPNNSSCLQHASSKSVCMFMHMCVGGGRYLTIC